MKKLYPLIFLAFLFSPAFADGGSHDSLMLKLNNELEKKKDYDATKLKRIEKLQQDLNNAANPDLNSRYNVYINLYEEYKSFNYNKAFHYAQKLQEAGVLLKDPVKIAYSKVKFGFILLSSGMFKEAFDSLKTVNVKLLDNDTRKEYYFLTARTYYDVADFDKDNYYTPVYNSRAGKYIDSAEV